MLMIGLTTMAVILAYRSRLARVHRWWLLIAGFSIILLGWIATVLEHFFWPVFGNYLEHICYAVGALAITVWCWTRHERSLEGE